MRIKLSRKESLALEKCSSFTGQANNLNAKTYSSTHELKMSAQVPQRPSILIIDDDEQIRNLLSSILAEGYDCVTASSAEAALQILKAIKFDLVVSDINMGGISGLDLVPYIVKEAPETVVVMISGQQTIDAAIQAMRAGAFDYITKPFDLQHVEAAMRRAFDHHKLLAEKKYYEHNLEDLVHRRTAEIERLAYFDTLTDLPNRILFEDRLTQALKHAQGDVQPVGTLLIRVDRFKEINDTLGHATGDRLLRHIADRIRRSGDERGTLARFEADEFALLITDVHGSQDVLDVLQHIIASLKAPFLLDEHQLYVTVSIGVSLYPVDGRSSQELLMNAGVALSRAQSLGRNNYQFYQAEMNTRALERITMERDLHGAIENGELRLHYQPQIDISTRRIVGAEALIRWQHPKLGLLPPAKFIPMAEDTGLVLALGEWALRTACRQIGSWHQAGLTGIRVSVNVSPRQFQQKNFVETVAQVLAETKTDPTSLQLEITETSIMQSAEQVVTRLFELKQTGLTIAIDDFGMGYSSLGYLKRLPIDMLKIDRSFVSDATTDPDDAALVMAIITLAHNLRLHVMAEGVETEDQLRFLHLLRCDEGQGYLFGRAVSPELFFSRAIDDARNQETSPANLAYLTTDKQTERFRVVKR
jgi:diguanylate cyclase (GGDEF)-like protein